MPDLQGLREMVRQSTIRTRWDLKDRASHLFDISCCGRFAVLQLCNMRVPDMRYGHVLLRVKQTLYMARGDDHGLRQA